MAREAQHSCGQTVGVDLLGRSVHGCTDHGDLVHDVGSLTPFVVITTMIYVSSADVPDGWSLPREGPGWSRERWRYRHWASGGASSLSPLLSDTRPIGLVRIQSPSPDQSQSQAKPGGAGDHEVKIRSASLAAPGAPFPRCYERFCPGSGPPNGGRLDDLSSLVWSGRNKLHSVLVAGD